MSSPCEAHLSDKASSAATTDAHIVMAEQITHDVVKEAQSMGGPSPIDATATTTNNSAGNGEVLSSPNTNDSKPSNDTASASATTLGDATTAARPSNTAGGGATANATTASTDGQSRSDTPSIETKEQLMNGDAGETSATESQNAIGDASGGSDTDISRPGSVDPTKPPGSHLRTNSVKKPTAFKSVSSLTKNFLAKTAVSAPVTRPGEKSSAAAGTATSTLQTARPRLVAKSGAGNVPRSLGKPNGTGSGPDASKVWNKNQPVPPAPPKHFTDEELKQQYGIHLATRLQADEANKEAKWADIDDDEDDWAPETVQWMDGTKSTVAAENQPPPPEEPKLASKEVPREVPKEAPKEASAVAKPALSPAPSSQRSGLSSGTKTILKPGISAQAGGAKPKGQNDKPTLVAKPSPAAPAKSPWAPLPPVEKVSPVHINPPVQQPPLRYSRDTYGYDDMAPPSHMAAKEIAPDDFNRAWREDRGNRELFNSHSGRYEPVGETRRGSVRDSGYRQQPSVLQRPMHDGPAEPSAAFQTSRTSADGPGWGRRRNSSNVSGGSGRRMSFDRRAPDVPSFAMNTQRRDSQSIHEVDGAAPGMPRQALPSKGAQMESPAPAGPPSLARTASPHTAPGPMSPMGSVGSQDVGASGGPSQLQNLVEVQERLLHANIDAIKLRKQKEKEQEAREEAERKERLRKRLEQMGYKDDDKNKGKDKDESKSKSPLKDKAVPVQSPPKPPVPTAEGEVAQYGMMKVHQPQPVKKPQAGDGLPPKSAAPRLSPSPAKAHDDAQAKPLPSLSHSASPDHLTTTAAAANNNNTLARNNEPANPTVELPPSQQQSQQQSQSQPQSQAQQSKAPAAAIAADAKAGQHPQAPWTTISQQRPSGWGSSVWGPPQAKDRALGNGTFGQQAPPSNVAPIGTAPALPSQAQQAPGQPFAKQNMYKQAASAPPQAKMAPKPGPIAPPAANSWANFHTQIRQADMEDRARAERTRDRLNPDYVPELRETFTDVKGQKVSKVHQQVGNLVKDAKPTESVGTDAKTETAKAPEGPSPTAQAAAPSQSATATTTATTTTTATAPAPAPATQGGRASRFFPKTQPAVQQESPPPPETESHPAFSGDTAHPVVRMPKPPPRVRLPPAAVDAASNPEAPVSMPSRTRLGIGARPLALTQEWQARFNSLLEKSSGPQAGAAPVARPSPPGMPTKFGSLEIAPSSKAPLENRQTAASATVSLPGSVGRKSFVSDESSDVTTRVGGEHLLEDREFGSVPTVKLSKTPHLAANEPPSDFPPSTRQHSRFGPKFYVTSKPTLQEDRPDRHAETMEVTIRIGRMLDSVSKSMPIRRKGARGHSNQKPRRNPTGTNGASSNGQNPRSRKPSNNGPGQGPNSSNSTRGQSGNTWSSNRSSPPSNPWNNKRPSPAAAPVH